MKLYVDGVLLGTTKMAQEDRKAWDTTFDEVVYLGAGVRSDP